jgi:hypothetical protein
MSSQATEARVAKDHGGQRTERSGAGHHKGDGRAKGRFRIENKETDNLTYRFHIDEWLSLINEAQKAGEVPVFHITLTDRSGRRHELAVLRYQDHLGLVRSAEQSDRDDPIGIGMRGWDD